MNTDSIEKKAEQVADILKLLAHPKRLRILCFLLKGAQSVGDIEKICAISQSQLSQFLVKMKDEGILTSEKQGQFVLYSISDERIRALITSLDTIFCQ